MYWENNVPIPDDAINITKDLIKKYNPSTIFQSIAYIMPSSMVFNNY